MNNSLLTQLQDLCYSIAAILPAIVLHEMAHGYASVLLGDETPRQQGRLSLNPLNHIDPMGLLCMVVFKFGWARPVQVNPRAYRNGKRGMVFVALAGPVMNFTLAFLASLVYALCWKTGLFFHDMVLSTVMARLTISFLTVNLGLGIFNLIPIPPLDGSKVLGGFLPDRLYFAMMRYERYGSILLFALIYLSNSLNLGLFNLANLRYRLMTIMLETALKLFGLA